MKSQKVIFVFACLALSFGAGVPAGSLEQYPIISTRIKVYGGLGYSWCDNDHIAATVTSERENRSHIIYLSARNPQIPQQIDVMNDQNQKLSSGVGKCVENVIVAGASDAAKRSAFLKGDRSANVYTIRPGQNAELLVSFKVYGTSGITPINLREKYIIAHAPKILTDKGYRIDEQCVSHLRQSFKVFCWDVFNRTVWPLSRFVLTEYIWQDVVTVHDGQGQLQHVRNREPPLLGKDGKPLSYALLLRDFNGQILVNLADDPIYRIVPVHGLLANADETYVYSVCRKKAAQFDNTPFVCRYPLDGKVHQWEEVFQFTLEGKIQSSVQYISLTPDGDIYFFMGGARYPFNGIWKFVAKTKQFEHITMPKAYVKDESPKVSPDGTKVAFLRSNILSIVQMRGAKP